MADDYSSTKVEVAGQILCELIRKGILGGDLRTDTPSSKLAGVLGEMYQIIWRAIDSAPKPPKST